MPEQTDEEREDVERPFPSESGRTGKGDPLSQRHPPAPLRLCAACDGTGRAAPDSPTDGGDVDLLRSTTEAQLDPDNLKYIENDWGEDARRIAEDVGAATTRTLDRLQADQARVEQLERAVGSCLWVLNNRHNANRPKTAAQFEEYALAAEKDARAALDNPPNPEGSEGG